MPDVPVSPFMDKTIGSLFAGIGGFDLGFERAGFKTTWAVEIDQKAQAVLRLRFPEAKLHDDVCEVGARNLESVDVVTFGSPCQDLSVAGKRAGLAGERSGLFHESVRIIRELRAAHGKPDFAIWENVPGAFSSNGGRDFAVVIQEMVNLGARDVAWRVLDSRFFGVAQRRRRVFLVSDFGGERAEQVLALAEGVRGYSPQGRKAREGTSAGAGYSPRTSGAVTSKWAKGGGASR
jgi:DNA (cytosine-5)-methyltransferase 1